MDVNNKDFVHIRQRKRDSGLIALFLRYYYRGKRREESLRLYLVPEKTKEDKRKNKDTMAIAETVRMERSTQLKNKVFHLNDDPEESITLVKFLEELLVEKSNESGVHMYEVALKRIKEFPPLKNAYIDEITAEMVKGFCKYLASYKSELTGRHLAKNTQSNYYVVLAYAMNEAERRGLIEKNPCRNVDHPKIQETQRCFLNAEELKKMIDTDCKSSVLKRAFLFSCFTGLRYSDIVKLTWGEVSEVNGMTRITFRQRKTGGLLYLDINDLARCEMGERKNDNRKIFEGLYTSNGANAHLRRWAASAGIEKHVTFHVGRHTFATIMLSAGTDIYTVSKLLGHTSVQTTQIYAKVIDEKRREAVNKISDILK